MMNATQKNVFSFLKHMKKVELHRHLEGSIRFETLKSIGAGGGRNISEHFCITKPVQDLSECMDRFTNTQRVFQTEEVIERVAYEMIEDSALDNVRVLEMRYSPQYIQGAREDKQLPLGVIHKAVCHGMERACAKYPFIGVGLIGILDRHMTQIELSVATDFIVSNADTFCAIDLANDEIQFHDTRPYAHFFQKAQDAGLSVTVHCGEVADDRAPLWILDAVRHLRATRIGHGIHVLRGEHDDVVREMIENNVTFEVCPTSNYLVGSVESLRTHPIRKMIDVGLGVTISTDDPGLFRIDSLSHELFTTVQQCNVTIDEIIKCTQLALDASFLPQDVKDRVWHAPSPFSINTI